MRSSILATIGTAPRPAGVPFPLAGLLAEAVVGLYMYGSMTTGKSDLDISEIGLLGLSCRVAIRAWESAEVEVAEVDLSKTESLQIIPGRQLQCTHSHTCHIGPGSHLQPAR